jgi:hypothetical protein
MAEERVGMASYNLEDVAQEWFMQLQEDEGTPSWGRFKDLIDLRFRPALRSAPLFELTECRRTGTVEEYSNRFQSLLFRAGRLDESQRVQLFTGGLLPPLSHVVRLHNPETLAMSLARQVELDKIAAAPAKQAHRALPAAIKPQQALAVPQAPPLLALPAPPTGAAPAARERQPGRRLSVEEQQERRRLGLCFNCDEKYSRGHNRTCRRLFFVEGVELEMAVDAAGDAVPAEEAPIYSLHVVAGVPTFDTLQVRAFLGTAVLVALLDTGSTHNFIGERAAYRSGLHIQPRPRLTATVANGERIICPGVIRDAPIRVHGDTFHVNLFVMPLAGFDLVLGTQWLGTLGPIVWDVAARTMQFQREGHAVCWTGLASSDKQTLRAVTATPKPTLQLQPAQEPLLDALLHSLSNVFTEPRGLPPKRSRDHRIILKPGALPVAVRPYRYPAAHKDELERQCAAMIEQGIVRRSDSAFSSPVLLVKKPDGSWRFCVDYRALNALTVKDAFPIPVVDELLDELHGAKFFTKLDLRSGYHQVRMRPGDVHMTAFRTHDGLYEFLVMPFGLCNAPATFQALMNDVLRPFLRRFVLVFFDDILIYSKSWGEHLRHLRAVLEELQRH